MRGVSCPLADPQSGVVVNGETESVRTVTPTLAPKPVISLPTIIKDLELPTGLMPFHNIYQTFPATQTHLRPYTSAKAAEGKGPKASPRK